ncbi:MAG: NADH-quinone oxidoreductase subunit [Frankiales bacterium]|nr:NADH-quinone oxidoreductase subunit [Frankiales bacterium]
MNEVVAGVGAAALSRSDITLELGPHHPSTHGSLRLRLALDGSTVVSAEPLVGALHRGAEKLFEARDYRQILVLANRHDWLAAFNNELGVALAVERMLGMEVPVRATWLRMLLAELNRVLSHLMFLGWLSRDLLVVREVLQAVLEEATGGRIHVVYTRVGGLREDVPAGWTGRCREAVATVRSSLAPLDLTSFEGLGILSVADALSYGVSGPVARASGLDMDLRRDDPYLAYSSLDVPVVLGSAGDAAARFSCLLQQVHVSLDLVEACLDRLPPGAVNVKLPKTVRAPEGSTYAWTEAPSGVAGYYLVSRGASTPWRLAMRTASFNNVSALPAVLPGTQVQDLPAVLASFFFVVGDIDK